VVGYVRPEVQAAKAGAAMTKAQKKNEKRKEKRKEGEPPQEEVVPDDWDADEKESEGQKEADGSKGETGEEESKAGDEQASEKRIRALRKKLRQVSLAFQLLSCYEEPQKLSRLRSAFL
jgi:hypothetical protein